MQLPLFVNESNEFRLNLIMHMNIKVNIKMIQKYFLRE